MGNSRTSDRRKWIVQMRQQIKALIPRQRKLHFVELQEEMSNEAYDKNFSKLYADIQQFVQDEFGTNALDVIGSPWEQGYPEEFLYFVKEIARPGSDGNRWDFLLSDGAQRCALLQGIITLIFDANVFSSLLFGAAPDHMNILAAEDAIMVNLEGFRRTSLRADTNKAYLQAKGGIPPLFWTEVDKVATQIMHLLIHVYAAIGENIVSGMLNPFSMFQRMHDIVAHAGWLSIAVRLSRKITTFEWIGPGQVVQQDQLCIAKERPIAASDVRQKHGQPQGRPRVMISVAPRITRYDRESLGLLRGKKTHIVMRPRATSYFGRWLDWEDKDAMLPLPLYLRRTTPSWPARHSRFCKNLLYFIMAVCSMFLVGSLSVLAMKHMEGVFEHLHVPASVDDFLLQAMELVFDLTE